MDNSALLDQQVSIASGTGTLHGTVTRTTKASIWVTFTSSTVEGNLPTWAIRFSKGQDGAWRQHGKGGRYSPTLEFAPAATPTWQVVCNELNDPTNEEVITLTGLDRATAYNAARTLQRTHNPDIARTQAGLNFFIRKDA